MPRLFEQNGYVSASEKVLPLEEFRLFRELRDGAKIDERFYSGIIKNALEMADREFPVIRATDYMAFSRTGDRIAYSSRCYQRRSALVKLVNAEIVEDSGRFIDPICNLIWLILEESTWVCNAHNRTGFPLSAEYGNDVKYIDLFSATTGATLAFAYYFLKDKLNAVTTLFTKRMHEMLETRIIRPFIDGDAIKNNSWIGTRERFPNNWNPWICSNVLFVTALIEEDTSVREKVVTASLEYLDNFVAGYAPDGGCDEGPGYWGAAGAAYLDCLEIINDMTDGKINIFHEQLITNMVEYIVKVNVSGDYFLNFADGAPKHNYRREMLATYAKDVGSDVLYGYALSRPEWSAVGDHNHVYRGLKYLCTPRISSEGAVKKAPRTMFLPDLQVAATRQSTTPGEGLYLAFKGGNNAESHNHNDIGSFIVYSNGEPLFIDAGSGTYTKRTFSKDRYTIWTMNSDYHNTLNFGDTVQKNGGDYRAAVKAYDACTGKLTLSLENAYPEEAGVISYERSAELIDGVITVTDSYLLNEAKKCVFSFLTVHEPTLLEAGAFLCNGRTVNYNPELSFEYESVVCDTPETENVPKKWGVEKIYRIRLFTPVSESGSYTLTIN